MHNRIWSTQGINIDQSRYRSISQVFSEVSVKKMVIYDPLNLQSKQSGECGTCALVMNVVDQLLGNNATEVIY